MATTTLINFNGSFLLVRHPVALNRLLEEIQVVGGDDETVSRAHIQKMSYLKCVLNESNIPLRLAYQPHDAKQLQHFVSTPPSPSTSASPKKPPGYLEAAAQTAHPPCSSAKVLVSDISCTTCTGAKISTAKMRWSSDQKDGKGTDWLKSGGDICPFMAGQGSASVRISRSWKHLWLSSGFCNRFRISG